jgi:hypothetical protein
MNHTFEVETSAPLVNGRPETRFRGFDVSVDGLSFLMQPEGPAAVIPGTLLQNLCFTLEGRRLVVDARIQHVQAIQREGDSTPQMKIGVEFARINPDDVFFLSGFIVRRGNEGPLQVKMKRSPEAKAKAKAKPKKKAKAKAKAKPKAKAKGKAKAKAKPKKKAKKRR